MNTTIKKRKHVWKYICFAVVTFMILFGTSACDSLVDVKDPDIVTPESLEGETGIQTLRAGSLGDFAVAMSGSGAGHGSTPGLITMSALMADEYDYSGTFPTRREADTRNVQSSNSEMDEVYGNLHRARASASSAIEKANEFGEAANIESEMHSIIGYVYVMFAETFCSGVPFSTVQADGSLEYGEPLTNDEMFSTAITHFDNALDKANSGSDFENLALVGKARAQLGLGRISEAAGTLSSVPTDFTYNIEHSGNSRRQENGIYVMSTVRRQWSIADGKGGNGLNYRSANDPRTPWEDNGNLGQDDVTPYLNQLKFTSSGDPVTLASGTEARLIEAEAAMQAGNNQEVEDIHNALRAREGLPADDLSGMNQEELRSYHFKERAFWLFSTGHRHGDLRRLVRVYGEQLSDVFPWGNYIKGGEYSDNVVFPVPQSEENNPNFQGCIDKNP